MPPKMVFLLGGHDLEMLTIKHLLEIGGHIVVDKNLRWDNAKTSAYSEEILHYKQNKIYGIELIEDTMLPTTYTAIDHHTLNNDKPSALEQVAQLIGHTLNRYEQLVAANDRGYIPAMKALSASDEEITLIRRNDRAAQGVSTFDELLAEQSIEQNLIRCGNLLIVQSITEHFSAICDRLFPYTSLLIYTDKDWVFYGNGKKNLVTQLSTEIGNGQIFYGGSDNGYIGAVRNAFTPQEINTFVKQIQQQYGDL